jgi:hypothetical protein
MPVLEYPSIGDVVGDAGFQLGGCWGVSERQTGAEFAGRWRITWTEVWDSDALDLSGPAYIQFDDDCMGDFGMIAIRGSLDCRYGEREGRPGVEFSWAGDDDGDDAGGRGWAVVESDGSLRGWLFLHRGDDSEFRATRGVAPEPLKGVRTRRRPAVR